MPQDRALPLGDKVRRLEDIFEITQLRAKFCRCVDMRDWAGYSGLLTEDYRFTSDAGMQEGRENVVAYMSKALADATMVHHVHTPEITFTGPDSASAIWPNFDYVHIPDEVGPGFLSHGHGWYHEDYVRTPLGWRMKRCVERRQRIEVTGQVPQAVLRLLDSHRS